MSFPSLIPNLSLPVWGTAMQRMCSIVHFPFSSIPEKDSKRGVELGASADSTTICPWAATSV